MNPKFRAQSGTNDQTATGGALSRLKRWIAVLTVGALAASGVLLTATPAAADGEMTGVVDGSVVVYDASGNAHTPDEFEVLVTAWRLIPGGGDFGLDSAVSEGQAWNLTGGNWSLGALPVGEYALQYDYYGSVPGVLSGFFHGTQTIDEAIGADTDFVEIGEDATYHFDQYLSQGGTLSGTVSNASSTPLAGQPVKIWRMSIGAGGRSTFELLANPTTDSAGDYAADTLPPGTYAVQAGGANGYVRQFSDGTFSNDAWDAEPAWTYLPNFQFASDIDLTLGKGSSVSGTVTSTSGAKLSNIEVTLYEYDGEYVGDVLETAVTGSTGKYTLPSVAGGEYAVGFASADLTTRPYLPKFWNNKTWDTATPITLNGTSAKTGINAVLTKAATIGGTISFDGSNHPSADEVTITACRFYPGDDFAACNEERGLLYDPATGAYQLLGLAAGSYTVYVDPADSTNLRNEYYSDARVDLAATRFTVATGGAVTGKNFTLEAGGTIAGYVGAGSEFVSDALIEVYRAQGNHAIDDPIAEVWSDENGYYSVSGLDPGRYAVHANAPGGSSLSDKWYLDSHSGSHITPVVVTAESTTGASLSLEQTQTIGGTVRSTADLSPVPGASVGLYQFRSSTSTSAEWVDQVQADEYGDYEFADVAPGQYVLRVGAEELGYVTRWANAGDDESIGNAQRLTVTSASGVSFDPYLRLGAAVTGRVVTDAGPVDQAWVVVNCWDNETWDGMETGPDGLFSFDGIIPGDCTISVSTSETGIVPETEVDLPALSYDYGPIDLGDVHLDAGAVLEGTVLSPAGTPVANVGIIPYVVSENGLPRPTGEFVVSDSHGDYALQGLPAGKIYLQFLPDKYPVQYLGGATEWSLSETVDIPSLGAIVHRDVRLLDGGRVSGKVTNSVTGKGVKGVLVYALPKSHDFEGPAFGGSAVTKSDGTYTITGLSADSYEIAVNDDWVSQSTGLGYTRASQQIYLPAKGAKTVNAKLTPTRKITGVVRDEAGVPLSDVEVEAYRLVNGERVDSVGNGADDRTGNLGAYELWLEPGNWVVHFSDPSNRVAETYYGGGQDPLASTQLVVSKSNLSGRNVVMSRLSGGISGAFYGDWETPSGHVTLSRVDENGDALWTRSLSDGEELADVNDVFPIENLAPGTYRLRVDGFGGLGHYGLSYAPLVLDGIVVTDGQVTDLGWQLISGNQEISPSGYPMVDPAHPPIIVDGGLAVGDTLWAQPGDWNQVPTETYYQWMRDGRAIPGATEDHYELTPGDVGHHIRFSTGISSQSYPDMYPYLYFTDETDEIVPGCPPVAVDAPSVSGQTSVGQTLKANPGTWSIPGVAISYRWIRTGSSIDPVVVSTASSYKLTAADLWAADTDIRLHLEVTAKRTGYAPGTETVDVFKVVPAAGPKVITKGKVTEIAPDVYKVNPGTWSPSGVTFQYLWVTYAADGSNSAVLGGDTRTDTGSERLEVHIIASKPGYYNTGDTLPVRSGPQVTITGTPQLSAVPQVGLPVSVDVSGLGYSVVDTTLSYQWYRDGIAITGAKGSSYTPSTTDAAKTLTVKVVASATGYPSSAPVTATATGPTLAAGTIASEVPTIEGTTSVGRKLTADPGNWSPTPTSWSYQWKRDGVAITGATLRDYVLGAKDLGKQLTVTVTGKRSGFANVTETSDPTVAITTLALQNVVAPKIPDTIRVGQKVTAGKGSWDLTPSSYSYQWLGNGEPIPGATESTYTPSSSDVGLKLCVEVTAKKTGYPSSEAVCSNGVFVDKGAAAVATAKPVIKLNGTIVTKAALGKIVTTTAGSWPVGGLAVSYQWQVKAGSDWVDIVDATHEYLSLNGSLEPFVAGNSIRVVVTATRSGYLPSTATSAPVLITG